MKYYLNLIFILVIMLSSCIKNNEDKLFELLRNNDFEEIKNLLDKNSLLLDTVDENLYSPLCYAVKNQNIELVEYLIEKEASVNYYRHLNASPFYLALTNKQTEILLDSAGFDSSRKEEIIIILVNNGLIVDENTEDGKILVPLIREIKDYSARVKAFRQLIKDTIEIRKEKEDSIRNQKEYEQKLIAYNKIKNIPIVDKSIINKSEKEISFTLHNVNPASKLLHEKNYMNAVKQRNLSNIEYCNSMNYKLIVANIHPFVRTVQLAYNEHRPLVISPDIVWLLICQGFSKHIELNHNKFRNKFIDFEAIKSIDVVRKDFVRGKTDSLWPQIIKQFSQVVKVNIVDTALHSQIVHSFSTTTEKEQIAFELAFLEINRHYFEYNFWACGIPKVTLEGNTQDWVWIRKKIEIFRKFDLGWWVDKLIPILDEFVKTSKGEVDLKFWSNIYRFDQMCGAEITGWFAKFFPYIRDGGTKLRKNPLVLKEPVYNDMFFVGAIENENFPSGLSYVDFNFQDSFSNSLKMTFVSGFVGIKQDHETLALKPEINWLIVKK